MSVSDQIRNEEAAFFYGENMPKVGKRHFAYNKTGRRAAKTYAKKRKMKVRY